MSNYTRAKVFSSPKRGKMTHMQNENTYTLCVKQPKRGSEGVWKITGNSAQGMVM